MPKSKNRRKAKKSVTGSESPSVTEVSTEVSSDATGGAQGTAGGGAQAKGSVSPLQFARQVRDEMRKITWTSRNETMVSTIMVMIMVALASIFFFAIDQILRFIVPAILSFNI